MRLGVAALLALAFLASAGAGASAPSEGTIVFVTDRSPNLLNTLYYRVRVDGSHKERLRLSIKGPSQTARSRDGRWLAYTRNCVLYVRRLTGGPPRRLTEEGEACPFMPAFSPDGTHIAFMLGDEVWVVDRRTGGSHFVAAGGWPSWSPDGRRIAYGGDIDPRHGESTSVHVVEVSGRHNHTIAQGTGSPAWSPDGTWIAFDRYAKGTYVIRPSGAREHRVAADTLHPLWSRDGSRIAAATADEVVSIRPNGSGRKVLADTGGVPMVWSPGGRRLVVVAGSELRVTQASRRSRLLDREPPTASFYDIRWSRNGTISYAAFLPVNDYELATVRPNGTGFRFLTHNAVSERQPDWSPSGEKIAFTRQGRLYVMDADGGHQRPLMALPPNTTDSFPAWSPDGSKIAFVRSDGVGSSKLYVVGADGSGLRQLPVPVALSARLSWSPDGDVVAYTGQQENGHTSVFLVGSDGTGLHAVGPVDSFSPAFSPDGSTLLFVHFTYYRFLWSMKIDGSDAHQVTTTMLGDGSGGAWSPSGKETVFAVQHLEGSDLETRGVSTGLIRLLTSSSSNIEPDWGAR